MSGRSGRCPRPSGDFPLREPQEPQSCIPDSWSMSMSARKIAATNGSEALAGRLAGEAVIGIARAWRLTAAPWVRISIRPGTAGDPLFERGDPSRDGLSPRHGAAIRSRRNGCADWWQLFGSPQLDAVIKEAISNNPGLEAARASLRASQNDVRSGYGIFYPSAMRRPPPRESDSALQSVRREDSLQCVQPLHALDIGQLCTRYLWRPAAAGRGAARQGRCGSCRPNGPRISRWWRTSSIPSLRKPPIAPRSRRRANH
jgi:hypothetical protein